MIRCPAGQRLCRLRGPAADLQQAGAAAEVGELNQVSVEPVGVLRPGSVGELGRFIEGEGVLVGRRSYRDLRESVIEVGGGASRAGDPDPSNARMGTGLQRTVGGDRMASLATTVLPAEADVMAPDGSEVRVLLGLSAGSLAHFRLAEGETSVAVRHKTVEEIWFFLGGQGEMWRRHEGQEQVDQVEAGTCLTLPLGTHFQFRSFGPGPLQAIGVTMPPWPGSGEAVLVEGKWEPTVPPGPL